jgi:outer membrane usher protein FimD/PapC
MIEILLKRIILLSYFLFSFNCHGKLYFDNNMIHSEGENGTPIDLTPFIHTDHQPEGLYHVDIYVNTIPYGKSKLDFARGQDGELHAIFDVPTLIALGVKEKSLIGLAGEKKNYLLNTTLRKPVTYLLLVLSV